MGIVPIPGPLQVVELPHFEQVVVPFGPLQVVELPHCEQLVLPLGPEQSKLVPHCEQLVVPLEPLQVVELPHCEQLVRPLGPEQSKLVPHCEQLVVPLDPLQVVELPHCEQLVVSACAEVAVPRETPIVKAVTKERVPAIRIAEKIAATNFFIKWRTSFFCSSTSTTGSNGGNDFYSFLADPVRPPGLLCKNPAPSSLVRLLVSTDDVGGCKGKSGQKNSLDCHLISIARVKQRRTYLAMTKTTHRKKQTHQRQRLNEVRRDHAEEAAGQLHLFTDNQLPSTTKHSVVLEGIRSYICPDLHPRFQEAAWMIENTPDGTYSYV